MSTWTSFGSTTAMTIKQPLLYENDNDDENLWKLKIKSEKLKQRKTACGCTLTKLFSTIYATPPGRFCIRLQEYAKGGWQVFLLFPYNALIMKE